jgi:hypothetical protein
MTDLNSGARTITIALYSNYDAYINNLQAITKEPAAQVNNCYYPDTSSGTCYITHSNGGGTFELKKVTDTFIQAVFSPSSAVNFGGSPTTSRHQF